MKVDLIPIKYSDNLPEEEVIAFNGTNALVGWLDKAHSIHCNSEAEHMRNITHYISLSSINNLINKHN